MMEKIEWYKEVLELEPNSRVFFPLARLLVDHQNSEEAITVLKNGLERHPDFMEARLFLIELMFRTGQEEACDHQIALLSKMFARYEGFWQAWAACLAKTPDEEDTASIIRFLAAHFLVGPLKISRVLDLGLGELVKARTMQDGITAHTDQDQQKDISTAPSIDTEEMSTPPDNADPSPVSGLVTTGAAVDLASYTARAPETESEILPPIEQLPVQEAEQEVGQEIIPDAYAREAEEIVEEEPDTGETVSIRTKSMAEVLADQGDYAGALDIYRELAASETDSVEMARLQERIAELESLTASTTPGEDLPSPALKKEKLLGILEALARRVEARMHN